MTWADPTHCDRCGKKVGKSYFSVPYLIATMICSECDKKLEKLVAKFIKKG